MDILDRYLGYETWAFRYFIERCREVSSAQLHQQFDIGHGTVHDTLAHVIGNGETWTDLMRERPVRRLPPAETTSGHLQRFNAAMGDFADCARGLVTEGRFDEMYMDVLDNPPTPNGSLLTPVTCEKKGPGETMKACEHILKR